MLKTIFKRVMWLARGTSMVLGLAVMLALVMGVATVALAAVPGDPFKLGKTNTINALSSLVGSRAGPLLKIDNNGTGPALNLQVEADNAPMTVNREAETATNLSADELDGLDSTDFLSADRFGADPSTYQDGSDTKDTGQNEPCMMGEIRLFGGNFAPSDWEWADGEVFLISQNTALFSILGNKYGGNGQTNFALPDMRGIEPHGAAFIICTSGYFPSMGE